MTTMKKMTKTFLINVDDTKTKTKIKTRGEQNRNRQHFSPDNTDDNTYTNVPLAK